MENDRRVEWIEPRWAGQERCPSLIAFARQVLPRNWWWMSVWSIGAAIAIALVIAKLYSQSATRVSLDALLIVLPIMVGLPTIIVLVGYLVRMVVSRRVSLRPGQIVYGSRSLDTTRIRSIAPDRSSTTRPRIRIVDSGGIQDWIGVASNVDLDFLERICDEATAS